MPLTQLIPKISRDASGDDPEIGALHGDPVLGFARVISQVTTNTTQFRGWGPNN